MSRTLRLLIIASISIIIVLMASLTSLASGRSVSGDCDGDDIVSDDELASANQDRKEDKISSDEFLQIETIRDNYPIEVTDSAGNIITVYNPLERAIVLKVRLQR
jgi:hypothetical protein